MAPPKATRQISGSAAVHAAAHCAQELSLAWRRFQLLSTTSRKRLGWDQTGWRPNSIRQGIQVTVMWLQQLKPKGGAEKRGKDGKGLGCETKTKSKHTWNPGICSESDSDLEHLWTSRSFFFFFFLTARTVVKKNFFQLALLLFQGEGAQSK